MANALTEAAVPSGTITGRTPGKRERLANALQDLIERAGADRYTARKWAQSVIGGESSNLPINTGLVDATGLGGLLDYADNPEVGSAIVPASFVKAAGKAAALPADDLFTQAVANTKGAAITNDGLLMRLQRNQQLDQGMRPSVRGGVFYLPQGAAQAKHYTTSNNIYGGPERIAGETLIQNPVFVKGATGGKAPEAAYDSLLGKGAYQSMRGEALAAYKFPGNPWDRNRRVEHVGEFLKKYAPEMADQAEYIVRNSPKGNQLAYALQEAAVASAVRGKGHDAVLGFSKQRTGNPFISEVFDVRERVYPDRFGGFKVW